ncbi:4-coumarate-CoA ligase [Parasponia andersonii]|uniref:4-coumarate-CoA ligase n=1 Tax=Parasponia andersonii TaxID=3476 RepID=A0A2P5DVS7_PARAD|nr:4-coumarate-CoA ligase [Parasponia andersonii]
MAEETNLSRCWIDPQSGYCPQTKTFHSLRPPVPLPPLSQPLSLTQYALSLLQSSVPDTTLATTPALMDGSSGIHVSYSHMLRQIRSLCLSLQSQFSLSKGETAFVLSPTSVHVPVVYFALLSLGVVVSPANPLGSDSEVAHQVRLTRPAIAFATSSTAPKLPKALPTVLLDSPEFLSLLDRVDSYDSVGSVPVYQTDTAAILYSSGTTGRVKGVSLTHRNLIALIAGYHGLRREPEEPRSVSLFLLPLFHVFGFFMLARGVALGETMVLMARFDFEAMLRTVERHRVTSMPVSPPLVVALVKSELTRRYDLSSLRVLGCGGAPLGEEVVKSFNAKFPNVEMSQGYGLTETTGSVARMIEAEETKRTASVGRLQENMEAKIVDPVTGRALSPNDKGELWLRGPTIMRGYVGDEKATAETLDPEGWLKTGDLCMFDSEGYLYIVDRLKELIKYKAYQVPPAELEHLLHSHPDIADVAVIPYPDEEAGQLPMAYVVRKPGSNLNEAQVIDFVAQKVAPYKKVRRVAFINSIPKSPAGKILRRELVNHALSKGSAKL